MSSHKHRVTDKRGSRSETDKEPIEDEASAVSTEATPADGDDRYLRLAADFENYKRRKNQELLDQFKYSSESATRALLPVLDNLERALEHAPDAPDAQPFV